MKPFIGTIVSIAVNFYFPGLGYVISGMIGSAAGAAVNGGNIIAGAAFGAFGGAFGGIGNMWGRAFALGMLGGVQSVMMGGKFGHGFVAAGIGGLGSGDGLSGFVQSAVLGGIASEITGGKFKNGAATAAFAYAMTWAARQYGPGGTQETAADGSDGTSFDPKTAERQRQFALSKLRAAQKSLSQENFSKSTLELLKTNFYTAPGEAEFAGAVLALQTNIANTISALESATILPATEANLARAVINGNSPTAATIKSTLARTTAAAFVWAGDSNRNIFVVFPTSSDPRGAVTLIHEASHFHPDFTTGGLEHAGDVASAIGAGAVNNPYNFSNFVIAVP